MKGLILSGGKGTRLLPLTYRRAKQLIPVANEPVLFRVIRAIRDAGIHEIGIVVGDTEAEIREAVNGGERWNVNITYIRQSAPAGLAHAVKESRDFLGDERFVMFLADNVIQGGISPLIRQFAESDWNSQIVLKRVPDPTQFGVAELNPDGTIKRLVEKPKNPPSDLALVGIYMFDPHVHEAVRSIQPSFRGELEITDAIQWLCDHRYAVHPYIHAGWWIDTGKMADMLSANAHVLEEVTPRIEGTVDEHSRLDSRVTIEKGAVVSHSIIRGPTIIGENSRITNAYIGPFTSIYYNVVIENSEIEHAIVLENSQIINVGTRIQDSLIGRSVFVTQTDHKPRSINLNLGDYSQIDLV
ncbi:MAG: glucose-1-phosphate thymidylyltransferase [Anaerolineales bacterium]